MQVCVYTEVQCSKGCRDVLTPLLYWECEGGVVCAFWGGGSQERWGMRRVLFRGRGVTHMNCCAHCTGRCGCRDGIQQRCRAVWGWEGVHCWKEGGGAQVRWGVWGGCCSPRGKGALGVQSEVDSDDKRVCVRL
jgi:hypothetical protein